MTPNLTCYLVEPDRRIALPSRENGALSNKILLQLAAYFLKLNYYALGTRSTCLEERFGIYLGGSC